MTGLAPELEALLRRHHADVVAALPQDTVWFDAHTHIGSNDPDGFKATAEEILGSFDDAGQLGGLVFPMHEPDGYPPANDHVIAEAQASDGRLVALCRVDPTTTRWRRRSLPGGRRARDQAPSPRRGLPDDPPRRGGARSPLPASATCRC